MCECPDGNEINPGLRDGANGGKIHAAAGLSFGPAFALLHREPELHERHVVEQNEIGSRRRALFDLFERVRFDFDLELRIFRARGLDGRRNGIRLGVAQRSEMVVLDQHHVEKSEAMIGPAAASDCVFFQLPQTGRGFARIKNLRVRAFDGIHELRG
jgi:hypothetical protein